MFERQVFVVEYPDGPPVLGEDLHLPDPSSDDPEDQVIKFASPQAGRYRYLLPQTTPTVNGDIVEFDSDAGHIKIRPLDYADKAWLVAPGWHVPGGETGFKQWALGQAGLLEDAPQAVYLGG